MTNVALPLWSSNNRWKLREFRALALELQLEYQAVDSGFSDISWNRYSIGRAGFEGPSKFWVDTYPYRSLPFFIFRFLSVSTFFLALVSLRS